MVKITASVAGEAPSLVLHFGVRTHIGAQGRAHDIEQGNLIGAAVKFEMIRRGQEIGLEFDREVSPYERAFPVSDTATEMSAFYHFKHFHAKKGVRALRLKLFEQMVLFLVNQRDLWKWVERNFLVEKQSGEVSLVPR